MITNCSEATVVVPVSLAIDVFHDWIEGEDKRIRKEAQGFSVEPIDVTRDIWRTPRRPPLLRDDGDPVFGGYLSDREYDDEWFAEHRQCFRLLSATHGDCRRAGLLAMPDSGWRACRVSRRVNASRLDAEASVFAIRTEQTVRLNSFSDVELEKLWWALESLNPIRVGEMLVIVGTSVREVKR